VRSGALALADGTIFLGVSVAADGLSTGEVVFNTTMTGYQEVATDPSYAGQVIVMTAPHIGNYGVTSFDAQSEAPVCSGFVVRSMSRLDSSWRSQGSFRGYLADHGVVALSEVDTRRLTRHVRERGAMPSAIGSDVSEADLLAAAAAAPSMVGLDLTGGVTTPGPYVVPPEGEALGRVVAYDFGMKRDIVSRLAGKGFEVHVVPSGYPADDVLSLDPTGVFLSNGPGDPEPVSGAVTAVRDLLGRVPVFGICLGHQILGLAIGASTFKLPFGHHGGNHPVIRLSDGKVDITSHNHGFSVDLWSLAGGASAPLRPEGRLPGQDLLPRVVESTVGAVASTHQNLNDGTLEGMECLDVPAFSVQYHPEAAPGPGDAAELFDRFAILMGTG
jgi:carbamoyl-phosphate synthase small subunit